MSTSSLILLGGLGALVPDAVKLAQGRFGDFPEWLRNVQYWIGLVVMVLIGIGLSVAIDPDKALAALALGYSGPSILQRLLAEKGVLPQSVVPPAPPPVGSGGGFNSEVATKTSLTSIRQWWAL